MKAQINSNKNRKVFSIIALLTLSTSLLFSQGILAETAAKLLSNHSTKISQSENTFTFASYSNKEENKSDSFSVRRLINTFSEIESYDNSRNNNDVVILRSFNVSDLNISIENEVRTEEWMTESFSNNIEENIETESWMTEPIYNNFEEQLDFEEWMADPFSKSAFEKDIEVEDWMTSDFKTDSKTTITVEDWMVQPLTESLEEEIEVENWMTTSF